ncbi:hypothetical protein [Actinoplanes couchii]|uniref:hypothetical protein n=1 Tax=Actinoplanes couchii TaxID=403638 RepID=UPI001945160F|nr:hypothetical protein [Actinoplanes couchii]MDR6324483.1 hypothetical protein [Actinoplanes couchii]
MTGLPEPMAREINTKTWYRHAVAFVNMKWPKAAAEQLMSIAEALATVTLALLNTERDAPADAVIRRALYGHSFTKAGARTDRGPMAHRQHRQPQRPEGRCRGPQGTRHAQGFPVPQVAEWAGDSVYVLRKVCAKRIDDASKMGDDQD